MYLSYGHTSEVLDEGLWAVVRARSVVCEGATLSILVCADPDYGC